MSEDFKDGEALAIQRAIGRLEGQNQAFVARLVNFESTVQRQLEAVAKEVINTRENVETFRSDRSQIEAVAKEVDALRSDVDSIKTNRSLVLGGWRTVTWIAVAFAGAVIFIITVLQYLMVTVKG